MLILAFSGRPAGRPVFAPLHDLAAPPPGISPAHGPCLAAPPLGPVGPAWFPHSLSSTTVAAVVSAPLRECAAPPLGFSPARGPRLAASHSGPVGPARIPRSLSSTTVAAVVFAPLRERAAPQQGISPARGPCPSASLLGPVGPARIPRSLSLISASPYVCAGRSGPLLRLQTISCYHPRGGRVSLLVTWSPAAGIMSVIRD